VSKTPFSNRSIRSAKLAAEAGAAVVVITDSHACPVAAHATHTLIVPCESPQFFTSYVATMVLIETIIGMLVARSGPEAEARILAVETLNQRLEGN